MVTKVAFVGEEMVLKGGFLAEEMLFVVEKLVS